MCLIILISSTTSCKNLTTQNEIRALVESNDISELTLRLCSPLKFGTAGLRAEMGAGFSRMNDLTVVQASQGLCAYLLSENSDVRNKGVVIGHDHRHNSESFARLTAAVFLSKGIRVHYFKKLTHTPMVPFSVMKLGASAGVMVTASHNPKNDNGYKTL
ncbi:Phosphoglucomutase-2 [Nowakowskiella sp. JEL0078]|nr:Phosphoglucomutase-2 [Nowakowskiella sp. JEL0078]